MGPHIFHTDKKLVIILDSLFDGNKCPKLSKENISPQPPWISDVCNIIESLFQRTNALKFRLNNWIMFDVGHLDERGMKIPQQDNYNDCGVFLLSYIEQICANTCKFYKSISFSSSSTSHVDICHTILQFSFSSCNIIALPYRMVMYICSDPLLSKPNIQSVRCSETTFDRFHIKYEFVESKDGASRDKECIKRKYSMLEKRHLDEYQQELESDNDAQPQKSQTKKQNTISLKSQKVLRKRSLIINKNVGAKSSIDELSGLVPGDFLIVHGDCDSHQIWFAQMINEVDRSTSSCDVQWYNIKGTKKYGPYVKEAKSVLAEFFEVVVVAGSRSNILTKTMFLKKKIITILRNTFQEKN